LTAALENAVRELGPDVDRALTTGDGVAYSRIVTGVWLRQNSMRDFLVQSAVAGGSGGVILMLAALGTYSVVGLMVATRTREIAVRVAVDVCSAFIESRSRGSMLFESLRIAIGHQVQLNPVLEECL
jgi:hypothetical protein